MENNLIELSMKILVIVGEASNDLEKAYEIVDNYIIGNKYKIGNNNNQIAINGFKDK